MVQGRERDRARGWRRAPLLALLGASLLGLAACEGDDGGRGDLGPSGPGGGPGPTGPTGPTGPGSGLPPLTIGNAAVDAIVPAITAVDVPADTGRPVVHFFVTDEEGRPLTQLAAANLGFAVARLVPNNVGQSLWESLTVRTEQPGSGPWPGTEPQVQGTTETATAGSLVDHGNGRYTYTFATDLRAVPNADYDGRLVHRIGMEIRNYPGAASLHKTNSPYTFIPATGERLAQSGREIVDDATCEKCHDQLEFHGGVRTDTQYCVVCHNPSSTDAQSGNTVDFAVMIHKIHTGSVLPSVTAGGRYLLFGRSNVEHDYSGIHFPADVRNCETCHEEGDASTPQASNWRTQPSIRGCGSCHDDVDFQTGFHHAGIVATDAECSSCHGPNSAAGLNPAQVHFVPEQRAAEQFAFDLLEVTGTAPGEMPRVTFRVSNPQGASPWNIHTAAPFTQCAGGASRLAIDIGWPTWPDFNNVGSGLTPAQPIQLNPLNACGGASTANADGSFTVTSTVPVPASATGTAIVALEGHPALDANGDGSIDRIPVRNAHVYAPITDATAVPRREVVDIERCDQCHGVLTIHGNNRTDNIQVCATCHNPNATDIARRVAASACVNELGADDEPIDLKYMIHAIHSANTNVCGFGNTAIRFDQVVYPGHLSNCEGCHLPDTYYPVDATPPDGVQPTTFDAGNPAVLSDDRAVTANTAACSACHIDPAARTHMELNGGSFNAGKTAEGNLAGGPIETCQVCHGSGGIADVKQVHQVEAYSAANGSGAGGD